MDLPQFATPRTCEKAVLGYCAPREAHRFQRAVVLYINKLNNLLFYLCTEAKVMYTEYYVRSRWGGDGPSGRIWLPTSRRAAGAAVRSAQQGTVPYDAPTRDPVPDTR